MVDSVPSWARTAAAWKEVLWNFTTSCRTPPVVQRRSRISNCDAGATTGMRRNSTLVRRL